MRLTILAALALLAVSCSKKEMPQKGSTTDTSPATVTYTRSTADIVNPERGFFQDFDIYASNYISLDAGTLASYRNSQPIDGATYKVSCSLIYVEYVLDTFKAGPISADWLTKFDKDCATARAAGVKLIPRFIYTNTTHTGTCPAGSICPPYGDAPKDIVLAHIAQLKPHLQSNEDVIAVVQLGFMGIWGENYFTDYFGDASSQGKLLDQNWQDRIDVLKAVLDAVPKDRMVQVRIPQLKERYVYGISANVNSQALTDAQAFTETDAARIGFHNDCFLSSTDDEGTYEDYGNSSTPAKDATTALRNYEAADTKYTAVGGETCDDSYSPQNDCEPKGTAQAEFAMFHYSFLNAQYNLDVNNDWVTGGCMDTIKQRLGYRLVMQNANLPKVATAGSSIDVTLNLVNEGYASPFNPRPVQLILRNQSTSKVTVIAFTTTDIRKWYTGSVQVKESLKLPADVVAGKYDILLNMPDAAASISTRPEYSIQLANTDTWEATTGYNKLNATLQVN